jgi:hypothetical protein
LSRQNSQTGDITNGKYWGIASSNMSVVHVADQSVRVHSKILKKKTKEGKQ